MTKLKFIGLLAAAMMIAAGAALNVNHSTNVSGLSDVSLANVEALSNEWTDELGDSRQGMGACGWSSPKLKCVPTGSTKCTHPCGS